jgi:DNA (cytosine-5)-methyltransferase 1
VRFGSLFSGIGGIDLGLERAGMECVWQAEVDPYCVRVLAKHWPAVPNLGDVTAIDWTTVERPDLICGGYPCQPFSLAGARRGTNDPRHLWPYVRDAICQLRPQYALLENVAGHLTLGLDLVLADLASLGFDAEWAVVPATWVGAPHRRERVIVVAHAAQHELHVSDDHAERPGAGAVTARELGGGRSHARRPDRSWWASEPDVGRVAHGVPSRVDRLRGLGNAVVPQVAEWVGRRIMEVAA